MNSIRIVLPAVFISTVIGALNGYVLSQWRFKGSNFLFGALLFGCFIPFQVILLPMAMLLAWLGLANTVPGLVLVHVIYGVAFTTLFFRNYYVGIPTELVRAARLDGAGFFAIFRHVFFASFHPHHCGECDLAIHSNLERLFVWGGLFGAGHAAHYCGT